MLLHRNTVTTRAAKNEHDVRMDSMNVASVESFEAATQTPPNSMRLIDLKRGASTLDVRDLHELQAWVHKRLASTERSRVVVDVVANSGVLGSRKEGTAYFRLEAPRCQRKACRICTNGGAHEPAWFVYWFARDGKLRSAFVGDVFDIGPIQYPDEGNLQAIEVWNHKS